MRNHFARLALVTLALAGCQGASDLTLNNGNGAADPIALPPGEMQPTVPTTPTPTFDPAAIPAGSPFLPVLAGHRLAVRGSLAAVSDPEGINADGRAPAVYLVDMSASTVRSVTLPDGARPGAIELTANGAVAWVVLEGSGGIASIDTNTAKVVRFAPVCRAPMDLAFAGSDIWIACLSGEVVKFSGSTSTSYRVGGTPVHLTASGETVHVALADATVVQIDASGVHAGQRPEPQQLSLVPSQIHRLAIPNSPRRIIATPAGGVALLFQQSVEGELIDQSSPVVEGGYSGHPTGGDPLTCPTPATRDAIVSGGPIDGILRLGATRHLAATLAIDAAFTPNGGQLAVVDAATGRVIMLNTAGAGTTTNLGNGNCPAPDGTSMGTSLNVPGATGVAYDETGSLTVLSADGFLTVTTFDTWARQQSRVTLRTRNVPVGFTLFHASPKPSAPTQPNVSCATCHPGGLNNGGAITIKGVTHKVMTLGSHLQGATGVHWDNRPFEEAVVQGTWKTNMLGRALTVAEGASLKAFVEQLQVPPSPSIDSETELAGRIAFGKAGCGACHDPSHAYTNNSQADVGRGMHRVPSLVGLAYSAPFMADGCAKTLSERFTNTACGGGELHGHPAALTPAELESLKSFLLSL